MSDYDTDILTWSERQAALLRRVAAGEAANEAPDWPHIIEEIEAVGQSQVDAVESWLYQALLHMLKAEAWPLSNAVPHWQAEAHSFRARARRRYRASMAQKLGSQACMPICCMRWQRRSIGVPPLPVPDVSPVALGD